jgi:anti-sigma B factor antagonist
VYEITFTGRAGAALREEFDDCEVTVGPDSTTLRASLPDQAALYGLLHRMGAFALELTQLHIVPSGEAAGASARPVTGAASPDEDPCRVEWRGRQAIVELPEHVNVSTADRIREQLLTVINRGAIDVIADMTSTVSCDYAGADALARAYQRAVANGTPLRLVVKARIIRQVLSADGLDRRLSVYPSLEAAVAAGIEPTPAHQDQPVRAPDPNPDRVMRQLPRGKHNLGSDIRPRPGCVISAPQCARTARAFVVSPKLAAQGHHRWGGAVNAAGPAGHGLRRTGRPAADNRALHLHLVPARLRGLRAVENPGPGPRFLTRADDRGDHPAARRRSG